MPLLKGKFDPAKFNAVRLAQEMCGGEWEEMSDAARQVIIDKAQQALDTFWREGVIQ